MLVRKHYLAWLLLPAVCLGQDATPTRLTLQRAVEIATSPEGNARVQLAAEAQRQAQSRSAQVLGAFLPNVESSISEQSVTRNLAALGVRFSTPIPGFVFPTFVGPFDVFDARATVTQNVLDFSLIRRYQASRAGVRAAGADRQAAGEQVAAQVSKAYLVALRTTALLEAVKANVDLAEAVLKQAEHQKNAGAGTGIEVTRARVQLSNEKQRQVVAANDNRAALLELRRAMNVNLDAPIELADRLRYVPLDADVIKQASAEAFKQRADLRAQQERERTAQLSASATALERLPSVAAFGDYGTIGNSIHETQPTRTIGITVRVPVFDGGRRDARRAESASQLRSEQIRTRDLRQQVQLDVQLALDALRSAEDQVKVAAEGLGLSENELAQARRRYEAGMASHLEVTDAQTRLARARDNQISALFNYNQARIELGQATGAVRRMIE
jgi:outer membrane protein TolC